MTANPTLRYASATKDATFTLIMALMENTIRGMIQMRAGLTPSCTAISIGCTTVINSTTVTTSTGNFLTSGIVIGMKVTGTGIGTGTYVTDIVSATSLTINTSANASGTTTLMFGPEDATMTNDLCVQKMSNIYINDLYYLSNNYKQTTTSASSACLRVYICNSGEDCDTMSCSEWNSSFNSSLNNIPILDIFGNIPIAVSNLTLTPGDEQITVSWGDDGQTTSIWAYHVALYEDETLLIDGWTIQNKRVIHNLTNGTLYKVMVMAGSFDGYEGPWTEKTATPVVSCTIINCGFVVT